MFTRLSAGRTMGEPSGTLKAFWNSAMFESGPFSETAQANADRC